MSWDELAWGFGGLVLAWVVVLSVMVAELLGGRERRMGEQEKKGVPLDFNGNGVPDYRESWFWRGVWHGAAWAVKTFAKPHTLAYRAVVAAEDYERQARGEVR